MLKNTYAKGDIRESYNLENYYKKIANYDTITTLPEENLNYIKEALPNVTSTAWMLGNIKDIDTGESTGCSQISSIYNKNNDGYILGGSITADTNFGFATSNNNLDFTKIENCEGMFANCTNLGISDGSLSVPQGLAGVSGINLFNDFPIAVFLFGSANELKTKNTSYMFYNCFHKSIEISYGELSIIPNPIIDKILIIICGMNTSLATDMSYMFYNAFNFNFNIKLTGAIDIGNIISKILVNVNKIKISVINNNGRNNTFDMKSCTNYKNMFSRPRFNIAKNFIIPKPVTGILSYSGIQIKNPPQLYYDDKTAFETEIGLKDGEYEIVF